MIGSEQTDNSRPPSHRIIDEVARRSDRQPTDLEPLYRYVDVEALDALVASASNATGEVTVRFVYADEYAITVGRDGEVDVERV